MQHVHINEKIVGEGYEPYFIAELGICHGGSVNTAMSLAEAAVRAGADCIKTETFDRKAIVLNSSAVASYTINGKKYTVPLAEHMDRYGLTLEEHHQVKKRCDELGVPFLSTAHDFKAVDFLMDIGAAAIKIASPDIVHFPLLRHAAGTGLLVIMDTGGSMQYEIEKAVEVLRQAGAKEIIVNHNPVGHPAPAEGHDLRIINRLQQILEVPVGISDHYEGYEMLYAATSVGANLLEKPVSFDRFVPEPERNWSVTVDDLPAVLQVVQAMHKALGRPARVLSPDAISYRDSNRSACAAALDLEAGAVLTLKNVVFGRPRLGIGVEHWDIIESHRLRRPKKKNEFIQWNDLD